MDFFGSIIESAMVDNLVMTLLHSLWQGAIAAAILWYLLHGVRNQPHKRYVISLLALIILVVGMFFTYSVLEQGAAYTQETTGVPWQKEIVAEKPSPSTSDTITEKASVAETTNVSLHELTVKWQHIVFMLWCLGVCVMLMRLLFLLYGSFRLRRECALCTDRNWWEKIEHLKGVQGIARRIAVGFSTRIAVPCTLGVIRPIILLPAAMAGMDMEDVEIVLLHELAHIKRLDWLVNIMQMLVESFLFFNPAVWWISRQIRLEREAACDSSVVTHTQRTVSYAELLLEFAVARSRSVGRAALALKGVNTLVHPSMNSLRERIKRLMVPGYRPVILPGMAPVLLTLTALVFLGMGAYKTTDATIRYFGKYMTVQEQAQAITEIKQEYYRDTYGQVTLPQDQWIQVKGEIITEDGLPLPTRTNICNGSEYTCTDASLLYRTSTLTAAKQIENDGTFEFTAKHSRFTLSVFCRGYAVAHMHVECDPGETKDDLVFILHKGYTAFILCMDQQGNPISNARITGGYPVPPYYNSYSHSLNYVSDENGMITLDNISSALMTLTCQASGFIKTQKEKISLKPNDVLEWVLEPAAITEIQVLDKQTGRPIEDAPVYIYGKNYYRDFYGEQVETTTDASGYAVLDSLAPEEQYLVMIRPQGMQRQYFIITGGDAICAEFEPARMIKGRIIGDLSQLSSNDEGMYIMRNDTYSLRNSHYGSWSSNPILVNVVSESEAVFQVDDYYGQKVTLQAGNEQLEIDINGGDDLDNVLIHLGPRKEVLKNTRKVTFYFHTQDGYEIPVDSKFKLSYRKNNRDYPEPSEIEILNNQAEISIILPNTVSWQPSAGTSFIFKEDYKKLDQVRDYTFDIDCVPAGSVFGEVNVPEEFCYQHTYMKIECLNRDALLVQTVFLSDNDLNMTSQPQTRFMFSPLPLGGRYQVTFTCGNMYIVSKEVYLTQEQPLCEMFLPWPQKRITLSGRIVDPNGFAAAPVEYMIEVKSKHHVKNFSKSKTDENGFFEFRNANAQDDRLSYCILVKPDRAPWFTYPLPTTEDPALLKLKKGVLFRGMLKDHAGHIQANTKFNVYPSTNQAKGMGHSDRTIETNDKGEFQVYLVDIDYVYYGTRIWKDSKGREWSSSKTVTIHPGKKPYVTIVSDPSSCHPDY